MLPFPTPVPRSVLLPVNQKTAFISPVLEPELGLVTFFGQWYINKCEVNQGMK